MALVERGRHVVMGSLNADPDTEARTQNCDYIIYKADDMPALSAWKKRR